MITTNKKPSLLLLHGALGCAASFDSLTPLLENHFEVHRFDFPGHGRAASGGDFSIAAFAASLMKEIEFIEKPVAVFGYSMGGYVALYAAVHYGLRINRLITLATKFDWTIENACKESSRLVPATIAAKIPAFANQLATLHGPERWAALVTDTASLILDMGTSPPLITADFQKIDFPAHLLIGEADTMVTIQETELVGTQMASASVEVLPATKHPLELVDKEMLANRIKAFITN